MRNVLLNYILLINGNTPCFYLRRRFIIKSKDDAKNFGFIIANIFIANNKIANSKIISTYWHKWYILCPNIIQ